MPELISPLELTQGDDPPVESASEMAVSIGELDAIRALVIRAHPDVVPELVTGETVADLLASVEPARAAWTRLAERLNERPSAPAVVETSVPAGGGAPMAIDPDRMPASEKIRRGLTTLSKKG
jgi:hypothetical protein